MRKNDDLASIDKKVGGYVRVSSFEQAEKGTSLDEQKRIIREECLRRGWQLVQIYCDEGASGKLTDRQGLRELQRAAKIGMFQTIMFTKSDRLTRSLRDLSNLWHDWTEAGIEIICVEQPEINSKGIY
jgi:site-specific DNA recombinase